MLEQGLQCVESGLLATVSRLLRDNDARIGEVRDSLDQLWVVQPQERTEQCRPQDPEPPLARLHGVELINARDQPAEDVAAEVAAPTVVRAEGEASIQSPRERQAFPAHGLIVPWRRVRVEQHQVGEHDLPNLVAHRVQQLEPREVVVARQDEGYA